MDPVSIISAAGGLMQLIPDGNRRRKYAAELLRADRDSLKAAAAEIKSGASPILKVREHLQRIAENGGTLSAESIHMLIGSIDVAAEAEQKARNKDAETLEAVAARNDAIAEVLKKED